ncbi:MAG: VIT1/CCC1 transporter family protein [Ilumatobacteraceae bacterium]
MSSSANHVTHDIYHHERHGRWANGQARAAVFGMSDGLVSNLSLVAGVAGASAVRTQVLIGGVAGLVGGAVSMAIGEYVSVAANRELFERELAVERREIESDPVGETRELAGIYVGRGMDQALAMSVAEQVMADPDKALEAHARDELGLNPKDLGSPVGAALASFGAFAVGAAIPLIPWFAVAGTAAIVISLVLGVAAAAGLGGGLARLTRRSVWKGIGRQVGLLLLAFVVTSLIGRMVGSAI